MKMKQLEIGQIVIYQPPKEEVSAIPLQKQADGKPLLWRVSSFSFVKTGLLLNLSLVLCHNLKLCDIPLDHVKRFRSNAKIEK